MRNVRLDAFFCGSFFVFFDAASTDVHQHLFKRNDQPFPFKVSELYQNGIVSRIQCSIACSTLEGCVAFQYKSTISLCTTFLFTTEKAAPTTNQGVSGFNFIKVSQEYEYLGCYIDFRRDRVLPHGFMKDKILMTTETCKLHCQGKKYPYFGTQYGTECHCGDVFKPGNSKKQEGECSMPCSGDNRTMCGGLWRISIYKVVS